MNLFDLIIILLFIVAPILSAIFRRRPPPKTPTQPASSPTPPSPTAAPPQPSQASASSNQPGSSQPNSSQRGTTGDEAFAQRLEQARRRVQEAMDESTSPPRGPTAPPPTASRTSAEAAERHMAAEAKRAEAEASRLQQRSRQRLGLKGATSQKPTPSPRARPSAGAKTAKLPQELLALDSHSLQRGIIWHEILSEPLSKRKSWRQPFRQQ